MVCLRPPQLLLNGSLLSIILYDVQQCFLMNVNFSLEDSVLQTWTLGSSL